MKGQRGSRELRDGRGKINGGKGKEGRFNGEY